jgi:hypothetical protein
LTVTRTALYRDRPATPAYAPRLRTLLGAFGFAALLVLAFLGLCQAVLPAIATNRLRSLLEQHGEGVHVAIHALPAAELLLGRADSVTVHIARLLPAGHGSLDALLERASHTTRLDATVGKLVAGGLELNDVSLQKRGSALYMQASVTRAAIASALPGDIRLAGSAEGARTLNLKITGDVLGHSVSVSARVVARDGALEIGPAVPVLDLLHVTVFADPQVAVDAVRMSVHGETYVFAAEGRYI